MDDRLERITAVDDDGEVGDGRPLPAGTAIGGYVLQDIAGRGGMGIVYRATDPELGRSVALKLIRPEFAANPRFRELFVRESLIAASIEHPGVIPVYRAGMADDQLFIAMRFVDGESLDDLIRGGGPMPPGRAARIVAAVAFALEAAHAQGLVHRDVKPANVLVADPDGDEHVYLTDFGISTGALGAGDAVTSEWAGTIAYLAPEQIRREQATAQTDVYALGAVLFHALTGRVPFPGDDEDAVTSAHLHDRPPRVTSLVPGVPAALDDVVQRAMAKRPEDRFETAAEMGRAILAARFDLAILHHPADERDAEALAAELRAGGMQVVVSGAAGAGEAVTSSAACAVLIGAQGLDGWARDGLAAAAAVATRDRSFRIVAVLLPGAPDPLDPALAFFQTRPWADLRAGTAGGSGQLEHALLGATPPLLGSSTDRCPYLGLEPFDEEHADVFVGRERDISTIVARLRRTRFLAVLGPSGSGKTSLINAGVVPALRQGSDAGQPAWHVVEIRPGAHPLAALAARLGEVPGITPPTPHELRTSVTALDATVADGMRGASADERLLIVVDQFEEVFTLCAPGERGAFLDALAYASTIPDGRVVVLVAMRADFYHRLSEHAPMRSLASNQQHLLGPLDATALRRVIQEPAAHAGLAIEPGLTRRILTDVSDRPGTLPLLSHVLLELWNRRRNQTLTLEAYEASGGAAGALARTADTTYGALGDERQRIAKRVLLRLTQPGEGTEDTRRRASMAELTDGVDDPAEVAAVVGALADARLLTLGRDDATGEPVVDIAHEALIRGWPRLRGWIDEDREALRLQRRLTDASREWEAADREESLLYRGPSLAAWEGRDLSALNDREREFLRAGRDRDQRDRAARRRRTRLTVTGLTLALLVVATVAGVALWQKGVASDERQAARSQSLTNAGKLQLGQNPELAVLLAAEAFRTRSNRASEEGLRRALHESHIRGAVRLPAQKFTRLADLGRGRVALVTADGTMQVWNAAADPRGAALKPVSWSNAAILDIAGVPGGRVATIDAKGQVAVGSPAAAPRVVGRHPKVEAIATTPDGKGLITVGDDGLVRRWPVGGGAPAVLVRSAVPLVSVAAATDGMVVVDNENGELSAWRNGRRLPTPDVFRGLDTNWVSAGAGGAWIGAANTDGFVVWRVTGDRLVEVLRRRAAQGVSWVAISPDGAVAAAADGDGPIQLWSLSTGRLLGALLGHEGSATREIFTGHSSLLSTGVDGSARVWNWPSAVDPTFEDRALPLADGGNIGPLAFLRDGRRVEIDESGLVRVWIPSTGRMTTLAGPVGGGVSSAAITPDGRVIATGFDDGRLLVRGPGGRVLLKTGRIPGAFVAGLALSRDGKTVAAASIHDGLIRLAVRPGAKPIRAKPEETPISVAFSPDGSTIAAGTQEGTTLLWKGDGAVQTLGHQDAQVMALSFSPDGRYLASAGFDRLVRVYDLQGQEPVEVLRGDRDSVFDVAFSADGRYLASAALAGARVWDWRRAVSVLDVPASQHHDVSVAIAQDGSQLMVLDDGGTVRSVTCDVCVPADRLLALANARVTRDLSPQERRDFIGT
jgi:WD40 repeat protein